MIKFGQKLVALIMILTFSISVMPAFAIDNQGSYQSYSAPINGIPIIGSANIKNGNKRLSVSLRDSDVKQALRMFADKAGLNIIFHDSVEDKTITLDLVAVTLNDALRMVMQASDLSYFVDGDTLIIMAADKAKELNISKQNMMVLPVKYTDAAEVASFLNKNIFSINKPGLSNTEIVAVNPAKNELLIFGTQSDYDMAKSTLSIIDTPLRISNFKVNHVTPKEMAKNICTAVLNAEEDNSSDDSDDEDEDVGSSGGGQSSGLSAGESANKKVSLGKAKMACALGGQGGQGGSGDGALYSLNQKSIKVMYYDALGTISVIGGSQDQIDTIGSFISATDVKQPMAYLEFSILELNEDGSKDFTTNWQLISQNFSISAAGGLLSVGGSGDASNPIGWIVPNRWVKEGYRADVSGAPTNSYHGSMTLSSYFNYLVSSGKGKVLANPKILVTSGKQSVIDLSHDYLKTLKLDKTNVVTGFDYNYTPEMASDAGIIVAVTPYISKDGYVTMNLAPTYAVTGQPYTNKDNEIIATPLIRRNLELSNIRVKDGDTLILGGLIQEENSIDNSKIPILGDIPGLGFFFRDTHTKKSKQELVILITPHIIDDSAEIVNAGNPSL